MALDKQIYMYSVDTSDFYYDDEKELYNKMRNMYFNRATATYIKTRARERKLKGYGNLDDNNKKIEMSTRILKRLNKRIKEHKVILYELFKKNKGNIRTLSTETFDNVSKCAKRKISSFESTLTRTLGIETGMLTTDIFVVQTFFFDVFEDLVKYGFMYNCEKYVPYTASAGQIRTKKTMFIRESVYKKYEAKLMCGLSLDIINAKGGNNVNKFLAYLALTNSATDICKRVNMKYSIVVDDLETMVEGMVDYIDDVDFSIKRQIMQIPISHTDGAGMIIPMKSKTNFMVRSAWIKGLLVVFDFRKFVNEKCGGKAKVKDIYGKEYDIIKDNIQVIFTKSQFKMWKFYDSWQQYLEYFYKYGCEVGMCNEEEKFINKAKINYQMLQSLTDVTDEELGKLASMTINDIKSLSYKRGSMLKLLGATKSNSSKNSLQESLSIYPELLNDTYVKEQIKQTKAKVVRESRAGRLSIDGKYTFISPDMYAFCEHLFLGHKNPQGLLKNGEVSTTIYKDENKLDCLRSPSLYREHAVRNNIINDETKKWFITKAVYFSVHDLISKILMCDFDGDCSLVVADKTLIEVAERNMRDIVPLYYEMGKANAVQLNRDSLYDGMTMAYSGGNIGMISNEITKIWNNPNGVNLDAIKALCLVNNQCIDFAKTLHKSIIPKHISEMISKAKTNKVPYFFKYVKGKKSSSDENQSQVEKKNNSTVNRLEGLIKNTPLRLNEADFGTFEYEKLMNNKDIEINMNVINEFSKFRFANVITYKPSKTSNRYEVDSNYVTQALLELHNDIVDVVDMLVKYFYSKKGIKGKKALWEFFGDIIYNNLRNNIDGEKDFCVECGDIVDAVYKNEFIYCDKCQKEIDKIKNRERVKRYKKRLKGNGSFKKSHDT
jgi:arsenate reductase-like glutaredoxin family protein